MNKNQENFRYIEILKRQSYKYFLLANNDLLKMKIFAGNLRITFDKFLYLTYQYIEENINKPNYVQYIDKILILNNKEEVFKYLDLLNVQTHINYKFLKNNIENYLKLYRPHLYYLDNITLEQLSESINNSSLVHEHYVRNINRPFYTTTAITKSYIENNTLHLILTIFDEKGEIVFNYNPDTNILTYSGGKQPVTCKGNYLSTNNYSVMQLGTGDRSDSAFSPTIVSNVMFYLLAEATSSSSAKEIIDLFEKMPELNLNLIEDGVEFNNNEYGEVLYQYELSDKFVRKILNLSSFKENNNQVSNPEYQNISIDYYIDTINNSKFIQEIYNRTKSKNQDNELSVRAKMEDDNVLIQIDEQDGYMYEFHDIIQLEYDKVSNTIKYSGKSSDDNFASIYPMLLFYLEATTNLTYDEADLIKNDLLRNEYAIDSSISDYGIKLTMDKYLTEGEYNYEPPSGGLLGQSSFSNMKPVMMSMAANDNTNICVLELSTKAAKKYFNVVNVKSKNELKSDNEEEIVENKTDTKPLNNPETGAFINISLIVISTVMSIVTVIITIKQRIFFNI